MRTKRTPDGQAVGRRLEAEREEISPQYQFAPGGPPQLPEAIIRFLRSKKNPDGSFIDPELPPVVPVKLPERPSQPDGTPAPGLGVVNDPSDEELDGQLQFNDV